MKVTLPEILQFLLDTFSKKQLLGRASFRKQIRDHHKQMSKPAAVCKTGARVQGLEIPLPTTRNIILASVIGWCHA